MNVDKLLKKFGGQVLANKARIEKDGKIIIIARLIDNEWEPTLEGLELEAHNNTAEYEAEAEVEAVVEEAKPAGLAKKPNARKAK